MTATSRTLVAVASVALVLGCATEADRSITGNLAADYTSHFSTWSEPANLGSIINTTFNEQGPTLSNDELSLYFGSARPGGIGGFDVWVSQSTRRSVHDSWTPPVNPGAPLNSAGAEQQPSLSSGGRSLLFASSRTGGFGGTDIWMSSRHDQRELN